MWPSIGLIQGNSKAKTKNSNGSLFRCQIFLQHETMNIFINLVKRKYLLLWLQLSSQYDYPLISRSWYSQQEHTHHGMSKCSFLVYWYKTAHIYFFLSWILVYMLCTHRYLKLKNLIRLTYIVCNNWLHPGLKRLIIQKLVN